MSIDISGSNPAYSLQSVLSAQLKSFVEVGQLSSGVRVTSAAVDPSGLAIYNNLLAQSNGADTANQNISDASNAINVAQGAASGIQDALIKINDLAIQANNGFNSPSDNAALQAQATQLTQQINTDSQISFNGTPLLDGTNSGSVAGTAPKAAITSNDLVSAGGNVLSSVSASAATTNGTFSASVDSSGNATLKYTDSATQATTVVGSFAANSSTTSNGTTITFGNFSAADASTNATVQTTAATAASTQPTVGVQSGPNEGDTTNVALPNATSSGLGVVNINLNNPSSATNAEGQITGAVASLAQGEANLGAQSNALSYASGNNSILSTNLTASASAIGDTNVAKTSSNYNANLLQQQISLTLLGNANTNAGHLNAFLSTYA